MAALAVAILANILAVKEPAAPLAVNALPALMLQALVDAPQEIPDENALIEAALIEQGFLSEAVPLTYELQDVAQTACGEYSVPYSLALAVMEQESGFQVDAVSPAGCYGLMQLNPEYFPADLAPAGNIRAGVEFLGELLAEYGDTAAALTAYHAGHDTGDREYADTVLARAGRWSEQITDHTVMKEGA